MIHKIVVLTLLILRLAAPPDQIPAFATTSSEPRIEQLEARREGNRINLNWTVWHNEEAYLFQVERSLDGRHFTIAGIVLGSDRKATEQYSFYEPVNHNRAYYRLRIADKNKAYSLTRVLEIPKDGSVTITTP